MSHIGNANKMISDTPLSDSTAHNIAELGMLCRMLERLASVRLSYIKLIEAQNDAANDRIKRLEEQVMDTKNKHAVLVADVVLNEDRAERIKRLEDRIDRASKAFFADCPDEDALSKMLAILEEERGKK